MNRRRMIAVRINFTYADEYDDIYSLFDEMTFISNLHDEAVEFLVDQIGPEGVDWRRTGDVRIFHFAKEEHAVIFKLRFG